MDAVAAKISIRGRRQRFEPGRRVADPGASGAADRPRALRVVAMQRDEVLEPAQVALEEVGGLVTGDVIRRRGDYDSLCARTVHPADHVGEVFLVARGR